MSNDTGRPLQRHSRVIIIFGMAFACVGINFWLLMTGHYRWPLFVLIACLVGVPLIIRKLPPSTLDSEQIRNKQARAASAARRLGWIYVWALILATLELFSGGWKELPWWAIPIGFGVSGFLIWSSFSSAKRLRKASTTAQSDTPSASSNSQSEALQPNID
jgi:hypothetical protein